MSIPIKAEWWRDGFRLHLIPSFHSVEVTLVNDGKTIISYLNKDGKKVPTELEVERIK